MKKNTPKEVKKYSRLNFEEREEIAIGLGKGMKQYEIALLTNKSPSTISREIKKNVIYKDIVRYMAHYALRVTRGGLPKKV
jgi:IS30 family transposase